MTDANKGDAWRSHSRLFIACGVVILSPFQYGFDFGMIGGLQAMDGFLKVRVISVLVEHLYSHQDRYLVTKHQPGHGTSRPRDSNSSHP